MLAIAESKFQEQGFTPSTEILTGYVKSIVCPGKILGEPPRIEIGLCDLEYGDGPSVPSFFDLNAQDDILHAHECRDYLYRIEQVTIDQVVLALLDQCVHIGVGKGVAFFDQHFSPNDVVLGYFVTGYQYTFDNVDERVLLA